MKPTANEAPGTVTPVPRTLSPSLIPDLCQALRPEMFPLLTLTQEELDRIIASVPGGVANVRDIVPLSPVQEGILFHHLSSGAGDRYLMAAMLGFKSRSDRDSYIAAIEEVIQRHEIFRTSILWEALSEPVQVILGHASAAIEEVGTTGGHDDAGSFFTHFDPSRFRIDVRRAPLLRLFTAYDAAREQFLLMQLTHHLSADHRTLELIQSEVESILAGQAGELPAPIPFRSTVPRSRLGMVDEATQTFFREMLSDVDEPTAPLDFSNPGALRDGSEEASLILDDTLARQIRTEANRLGMGPARLFHLAWARVIAKLSGSDDVVFGTVLSTRSRREAETTDIMGPLVNTLPLRVRIGEEGVAKSLRHVHALLAELVQHRHTSLTLARASSSVPCSLPLFTTLLNYRHRVASAEAAPFARGSSKGIHRLRVGEYTEYPFSMSIDESDEGFVLTAQTPKSVKAMRLCEYLSNTLASLTDALESCPETPVRALRVMSAQEVNDIVRDWNRTLDPELRNDICVHELFETQADRSPDAVALVFRGQELSYAELNQRANQLAHYLRELGVGTDTRVAVCLDRSLELVIGLLAVIKAGGAYVPLDPTYPEERLRFMIADSAPVVLLASRHLNAVTLLAGVPVVDVNGESAKWQAQAITSPARTEVRLTPQSLVYVIYTSGSTGTPKGVAMPHEAITNMLRWQVRQPGFRAPSRVLQFAALGFDVAFQEVFSTLCSGGTLVLLGEDQKADLSKLLAFTIDNRIQRLFLPYAALRLMAENTNSLMQAGESVDCALREIIVAGEQLRVDTEIAQFLKRFSELSVQNQYGPTETHVATFFTMPQDSASWPLLPPIGRPVAKVKLYVLDRHSEPVPIGVTGELYIGGAGVARGYLNRPELTAARFLKDTFCSERHGRMYRTGDLGRVMADGNLEFLGRNDLQVKIRGFRVELGEIEARLTEHDSVGEAVVVARQIPPYEQQLVAYYTQSLSSAQSDSPTPEQFRLHLLASLPEPMIPACFVKLETLPMTSSGKVDRRSLPSPDPRAFALRGYEAPQGELEVTVARVWAEMLKITGIGRHDNFFSLGGHSLLAMRVTNRLRQDLKTQVAIADIFAHPVLADLARNLRGEVPAPPSSIPRRQKRHVPEAGGVSLIAEPEGGRTARPDRPVLRAELLTRQGS